MACPTLPDEQGTTSLLVLFGLTALYLVLHRHTRQPWQRYGWERWYWILFLSLDMAGMLLLGCLPVLFLVRATVWLYRRSCGRK